MAARPPTSRVIGLIDMDCFYVQVHLREQPELVGKPVVVVQYRDYRKGGVIAVSYEARACGVKRGGTFGADAEKVCPDVTLVKVPEARGKADLTIYRNASTEVFAVLNTFDGVTVERASVDEAYVDMTNLVDSILASKSLEQCLISPENLPSTFVIPETSDGTTNVMQWYEEVLERGLDGTGRDQLRLLLGATLVSKMRAKVLEQTGFHCSAGISHNKTLAKLACGVNKPRKQTVFPFQSVKEHFKIQKISKVRALGGKLGAQVMTTLGVEMMSDLTVYSLADCVDKFGDKTGSWLHWLSKGIEYEEVTKRDLTKSIGCGKNFNGPEALNTVEKVKFWLGRLSAELFERLTEDSKLNERFAKSLTVSLHNRDGSFSRAADLSVYDAEKFAADAYRALLPFNSAKDKNKIFWSPPMTNLTVNASKFVDGGSDPQSKSITTFFNPTSFENYQNQMNEQPSSVTCVSPANKPSNNPGENPAGKLDRFFNSTVSAPMVEQIFGSCLDGSVETSVTNKKSSKKLADYFPPSYSVLNDPQSNDESVSIIDPSNDDLFVVYDGNENETSTIPGREPGFNVDDDGDSCDFLGLLNELSTAASGDRQTTSEQLPTTDDLTVKSCLDNVISGVLAMNVDDTSDVIVSVQSGDHVMSKCSGKFGGMGDAVPMAASVDLCESGVVSVTDLIVPAVKRKCGVDLNQNASVGVDELKSKRLKLDPGTLNKLAPTHSHWQTEPHNSNRPSTSTDVQTSDSTLPPCDMSSVDFIELGDVRSIEPATSGQFVDYIPDSFDSVDKSVWDALPPELSMELKQFYRSQKPAANPNGANVSSASVSKKPTGLTKAKLTYRSKNRQSSSPAKHIPISLYFDKIAS